MGNNGRRSSFRYAPEMFFLVFFYSHQNISSVFSFLCYISAFSKFGEVTQAHIVIDRETQRSKGFGFITFANERDATNVSYPFCFIVCYTGTHMHTLQIYVSHTNGVLVQAKNAMSDKELDGRPIRIDFATRREGGGGGRDDGDRRPRDSYADRQPAYNDRSGGRYVDSGDRFGGGSRDRGAPPVARGGRDYTDPVGGPASYRDEPRRGGGSYAGDRGGGGGYASGGGRDSYADRPPVGGYDDRGGRPTYDERRGGSVGRGGYDDRDAGQPYQSSAPGGGAYGRGGGHDSAGRGGGSAYGDRRPIDDRLPPRGGDSRGACVFCLSVQFNCYPVCTICICMDTSLVEVCKIKCVTLW